MIIDRIEKADLYRGLGPRIQLALETLRRGELSKREPGKYELDGERVYAMVQTYETRPRDKGVWEAHRKFIDVQFVIDGIEQMGYANLSDLKITTPYDEKDDYLLAAGEGSFVTASAGTFTIFFPHDAHMPGQAIGQPATVRKIVVKVAV